MKLSAGYLETACVNAYAAVSRKKRIVLQNANILKNQVGVIVALQPLLSTIQAAFYYVNFFGSDTG